MNLHTLWLVGVGGVAGTLARYYLGIWVRAKSGPSFPWGTWCINLSGSFILGILYAAFADGSIAIEFWWLLGVGFCGAFTTFSTFGYELQQLIEKKQASLAAIYLLSSIVLGILLAWCGIVLGG